MFSFKKSNPKNEHWVFVLGWLDLGGAERQALYLASHLKNRRGAKVTVIGLSTPGVVMEECNELGIECISWPFEVSSRFDRVLRAVSRFTWKLKELQPTFILPYCMPSNIICGLSWHLTGAKACVWQQRDEGRFQRNDWIESLAVKLTPAFISNSSHAGDWLCQTLNVPSDKIKIIRNGIVLPQDGTKRGSWRLSNSIDESAYIVTMVANFGEYKDHMTLVKAWDILQKKISNKKPILVLAGRHSNAYSEIEKFVNKKNIQHSVIMPGFVNDISSLLCDTNLLVFSSRFEGVPNGILEGMAHKLPVVATDIPGIREALGDDFPEQFARVDDEQQFAERILQMVNSEKKAEQIGLSNYLRVSNCYSLETMVEETQDFFIKVAVSI